MNTQAKSTLGGGGAQRMDSRIELGHLPVLRVVSGYKIAGTILGLVGGGMALGGAGILHGEFTFWGLLSPFTWVGTAIFLAGVHLAILRKEVGLDRERVSVRSRGLVGRKAWSEPLANYQGVMLRSKWEAGGRNQHAHQVFLVELQHGDPMKTVEIFQSVQDKGWHATWREVNLRFRLLALEETPGGVVATRPEDLEKSIREKMQAGALEIAFDPSVPPPAGLAVQAEAGGLDIRVLQRNWRSPGLWTGLALILSGGILSSVLLAWRIPGPFMILLLAGFGVAAAGQLLGFWLSRPRLRVGRESVVASLMTPLGEMGRQAMDTARISGVQIGAPKGQASGSTLHILTDDGRVYFGAGLSPAALEWLRNCLLAAVARL